MCYRVVFSLIILNIYLITTNAKELQNDVTTLPTPLSTLQRSISAGLNTEAESLTKRDLKATDSIGLAAKSYDPPPEFYRGPGSTGHLESTQASSYYNNYKPYDSFKSRPVEFPDNNNYNKYNGAAAGGGDTDNSYNSWQHLKAKVGVPVNKKDALQDRISVGHYGSSSSGGGGGGYSYEGRPYGSQTQHTDYYGSSAAPPTHTAGYYGTSAAAESVPFDVYGGKNHYSSLAGNDYAAYSYSDIQDPAIHKSHSDISHKALLAKSFLIPLASAAVLGIAAALVSNPLLLQLGTVSGVAPGAAIYGKRKRRDLTTSATSNEKNTNSLDFTVSSADNNKKDSKLLPYRGHHQEQKEYRH